MDSRARGLHGGVDSRQRPVVSTNNKIFANRMKPSKHPWKAFWFLLYHSAGGTQRDTNELGEVSAFKLSVALSSSVMAWPMEALAASLQGYTHAAI